MTFSRGDKVYFQAYDYTYTRNEPARKAPSGEPYEIGVFVRYNARGNVVVNPTYDFRISEVIAVDKRIGLPVEVTFPAENCG